MFDLLTEIVGTLISAFIIFMCVSLLSTERGRIWLYKQLLKLYPKQHRADFGDEMLDDFQRECERQKDGIFGIMCIVGIEFWNAIRTSLPMRYESIVSRIILSLNNILRNIKDASETIVTSKIMPIFFEILLDLLNTLMIESSYFRNVRQRHRQRLIDKESIKRQVEETVDKHQMQMTPLEREHMVDAVLETINETLTKNVH